MIKVKQNKLRTHIRKYCFKVLPTTLASVPRWISNKTICWRNIRWLLFLVRTHAPLFEPASLIFVNSLFYIYFFVSFFLYSLFSPSFPGRCFVIISHLLLVLTGVDLCCLKSWFSMTLNGNVSANGVEVKSTEGSPIKVQMKRKITLLGGELDFFFAS